MRNNFLFAFLYGVIALETAYTAEEVDATLVKSIAERLSSVPALPSGSGLKLRSSYESFKDGEAKKSAYGSFEVVASASGDSPLISVRAHPYAVALDGGPEEYFEHYFTGEFNGKYWLYALERQGYPSDIYSVSQATIAENPHPMLNGYRFKTGLESFAGWIESWKDGERLFSILGENPGQVTFSVTEGEDGLIRVALGGTPEVFSLDPSKGFALVEHKMGDEQYSEVYSVSGHQEVFPNLWLPRETLLIRRNGEKELYRQRVFDIEIDVLSPDDYKASTLGTLSPGWTVEDERFDVKFEVSDSPEDIIEAHKKAFD